MDERILRYDGRPFSPDHLLLKIKEDLTVRIEMAKKVSDRVSKSNREAVLREQLRVIQEELGEGDGTASPASIV